MTGWKPGKRLTQKEFERRIYKLVEDEYVVKGDYINKGTKIDIQHRECGRIESYTPAAFYKGSRCKYCVKGNYIKDTEWFRVKVRELTGNEYRLIGNYTRAKDKTKVKHETCGTEWEVTPDNFIGRESRCPKCAGNMRTDTEGFKRRLEKVFQGEYTTEGTYVNARTKMSIRHEVCGTLWEIAPDTILNQKVGCPSCSESKGERYIRYLLETEGIKYEPQKRFEGCRNKNPLPFDFYLPEHNLCIEFDGIQHYEPTRFGGMSLEDAKLEHLEIVKNDNIKNSYCEEEGIKLLRVPYYHTEEEIKNTVRSNVESPTPKSRIMI